MFNFANPFSKVVLTAFAAGLGLFIQANVLAQQTGDVPNPRQYDTIEADEFIREASAKNLAEIETARLALESASSKEVKEYAQHIIDDHKKANRKLRDMAREKKVELSDDPALMDQAKALILEQRDKSFDEAYANNQVAAHEQTIALFEQAARSNDPEIESYANQALPKLKQHLERAKELVKAIDEENV